MRKNGGKILLVILIIFVVTLGAFVGGVYLGYGNRPPIDKITSLYNLEENKPSTVDFSPFWQAWHIIEEKYVDASATTSPATTDQEKVWGAIAGLVDSLGDPYSVFLPPEESKQFEEDIRGSFGGIGIEIDLRDGVLTVVTPLEGTPAKKAGLLPEDKIVAIDDELAANLTVDEAVDRIRGEIGTTVKLTLLREKSREPIEVELTRSRIEIPTLKTEMRDGVFVIRLYGFNQNATRLFRQALREFVDQKTNKLILDLRGNPGGLLSAAVDIASWFLPKDAIVVTEDHGDGEEPIVFKSRGQNVLAGHLEMVVLVDKGSASASEILAGALSEHGIATLVGEETFGKGSVQELIDVTPESRIKITVARWVTPSGKNLSAGGLKPDVVVEWPEDLPRDGDQDPQLDKAIEILNNVNSSD